MTRKQLAALVTALVASQDGFTITGDGKPLQRGYVVGGLVRAEGDALAKIRQPKTPADYQETERRTAEILSKHRAAIDAGAAIGGWRQGDTVSLDLVTTHTSRKHAAAIAREREQLAFGYLSGYRYQREYTA